jgi:dCTP deaminase
MLKGDRIADILEKKKELYVSDPLIIAPMPDIQAIRDSGSASMDMRLGTWFVNVEGPRVTHAQVQSDRVSAEIVRVAGEGDEDQSDITMGEGHGRLIARTQYVPFGRKYVLHPGSFVLGVTMEWIRMPGYLGGYVVGRSSWGRRGLIVATAIGVHPCFTGCLTLELCNTGEVPLEILPGMTVCQLFLHWVITADRNRKDKSQFVCRRKPILSKIVPDPIALKLAQAYEVEKGT